MIKIANHSLGCYTNVFYETLPLRVPRGEHCSKYSRVHFYPFDAPQLDQVILVLNLVLLCKSWVWDSGMLGSCAIEISVLA